MPTRGRQQVSPGQTIQSAQWGNPVWDQSVQAFENAADRDNQFPAPQEGAVCYLADVDGWTGFQNGRWVGLFGTSGRQESTAYTRWDGSLIPNAQGGVPAPVSALGNWDRIPNISTVRALKPGIFSISHSVVGSNFPFQIWIARNGTTVANGTGPGRHNASQVIAAASWVGHLNLNDTVGALWRNTAAETITFSAYMQIEYWPIS